MKSHTNPTESLLKAGKDISLTSEEHSNMKSELLEYAHFHTPSPAPKPKRVPVWAYAGAFASLVVLIGIGTGFAATTSLPGETLYGVKVEIVEPLVGLSYHSETGQLTYQVALMNRRLDEVQTLTRAQVLQVEQVVVLEELVKEHTATIERILESDTNDSVPSDVSLTAISDVIAITQAHERIIEQLPHKVVQEYFEVELNTLLDRYALELVDFEQETTPEEKRNFITGLLGEIEAELVADFEHTSTSTRETQQEYLSNLEAALAEEDYSTALFFAGEMLQDLDLQGYLLEATPEYVTPSMNALATPESEPVKEAGTRE
jgi:hypothetical protein